MFELSEVIGSPESKQNTKAVRDILSKAIECGVEAHAMLS